MGRFALMTGAALLAATAAGSAQAHDWGGGTCVGYGCARPGYDDGYRVVRRYEDGDVRPGLRVYEHRRLDRHPDWDDDDLDD